MKFIARLAAILVLSTAASAFACTEPVSVCVKPAKSSFALIRNGQPTAVLIEDSANSAVKLASASFVTDLQPGEWVSMHWGWICDRLSARQLRNLQAHSNRTLEMTNHRLAHPGPAIILG